MRLSALVIALLALTLGLAGAQQVNDPDADVSVAHPDFPKESGPVIAIDSGHNNFHTIDGRYQPFAALLRNDGFRLVDSKSAFTGDSLSAFQVLVISNALPAALVKDWALPPASAFTPAEIGALKTWVENGGALLLIADHRPFAGSARDLASAFGFTFEDGVVERDPLDSRSDIFTLADGSLHEDVVTRGRDPATAVTALRTFTGSSFQAPPTARPIIVLPPGYMSHQCLLPCRGSVPETDIAGHLQGAVMDVGKGRVAVFGEAGMFSAQVIKTPNMTFHFGFNARGAEQNKQFILNLMQWLTGVLPQ
ncbi:MAG TPA: hypothetical protein VFI23_07900 [Rhizomicrobium sp.]|nr:hypothetical protein [Rhizomicrobium sp.]